MLLLSRFAVSRLKPPLLLSYHYRYISKQHCSKQSDDIVIRSTRKWLVDIVQRLNLCPFSGPFIASPEKLNIKVLQPSFLISDIINEAKLLITSKNNGKSMTSLLCLPHLEEDFSSFLDVVDTVQKEFDVNGLSDEVQIATFHPKYNFADSNGSNDVTNYTNRSPYPVLHLLLEEEVGRALESYRGNFDNIWRQNKILMTKIGYERMEGMLCDTKRDS